MQISFQFAGLRYDMISDRNRFRAKRHCTCCANITAHAFVFVVVVVIISALPTQQQQWQWQDLVELNLEILPSEYSEIEDLLELNE